MIAFHALQFARNLIDDEFEGASWNQESDGYSVELGTGSARTFVQVSERRLVVRDLTYTNKSKLGDAEYDPFADDESAEKVAKLETEAVFHGDFKHLFLKVEKRYLEQRLHITVIAIDELGEEDLGPR